MRYPRPQTHYGPAFQRVRLWWSLREWQVEWGLVLVGGLVLGWVLLCLGYLLSVVR